MEVAYQDDIIHLSSIVFVTHHGTGDWRGGMPEHNLQFLFLSTLMEFSINILSSQYQPDKAISVTNIHYTVCGIF